VKYISIVLFAFMVGAASPVLAQNGWTIHANLTDHILERQGTLVLQVSRTYLAFDVVPWIDNPDGRSRIVVDRQAGVLYLVDSATRAVRRLALDAESAATPGMPALPEGLPEEMRAQVEKAMRESQEVMRDRVAPAGAATEAKWMPTGTLATVVDTPCAYYEQEHAVRRERQASCFAMWEAFPPGYMLRDALDELGALPFVSASGARPFLGSADVGFPLVSQDWSLTSRADMEAVLRRETMVTLVEPGIQDPDLFIVPQDWPVTDL